MEWRGGLGVVRSSGGDGSVGESVGAQVGVMAGEGGEEGEGSGGWEGAEEDVEEEEIRVGDGGEEAEGAGGGGGATKVGNAAEEGSSGDEVRVIAGDDGVGENLVEVVKGGGGRDEAEVEGLVVAAHGHAKWGWGVWGVSGNRCK